MKTKQEKLYRVTVAYDDGWSRDTLHYRVWATGIFEAIRFTKIDLFEMGYGDVKFRRIQRVKGNQ